MNLALLMSILAVTTAAPAGNVLTVDGATGRIARSERTQTLRAGAPLEAGDSVTTGGLSMTVLLDNDLLMYTKGDCDFQLLSGPADILRLHGGEYRFTSGTSKTVRTNQAIVTGQNSVWRLAAAEDGTHVRCVSGSIRITGLRQVGSNPHHGAVRYVSHDNRDATLCRAGEEYLITNDNRIVRHTYAWTLDANLIALSGAARRGRQELEQWALTRSREICRVQPNPACQNLPEDSQQVEPWLVDAESSQRPNDTFSNAPDSNAIQEPSAAASTQSDLDNLTFANSAPISTSPSVSAIASASTNAGGNTTDAGQATLVGRLPNGTAFPGTIHLLTAETSYSLNGLPLNASERAQLAAPEFWSIGLGDAPSGQVTTSFLTGSAAKPVFVRMPNLNAYLVRLDQFAITDPTTNDPTVNTIANVGVTGLIGTPPVAPIIDGAEPLRDTRGASASFNSGATFALGEFRTGVDANGAFEVAIRRSAQDRTIVKDVNGNDALDQVRKNPDARDRFVDVSDPLFQPAVPLVKAPTPDALDPNPTRFSQLNVLRRAATTTLVAEKLFEFSRRTGQTRFVVDGQIIDISGYQRP